MGAMAVHPKDAQMRDISASVAAQTLRDTEPQRSPANARLAAQGPSSFRQDIAGSSACTSRASCYALTATVCRRNSRAWPDNTNGTWSSGWRSSARIGGRREPTQMMPVVAPQMDIEGMAGTSHE